MPLGLNFTQIFLHLFNFLLLFAILYFLLYKPVKNFMIHRQEVYKKEAEETAANLERSEKARTEYEQTLAQADEEIAGLMAQSDAKAQDHYDRQVKAAKEEAEKILRDAREEAERQKAAIVQDAQKDISDLVTEATEKLALHQSSEESFQKFLDSVGAGQAELKN